MARPEHFIYLLLVAPRPNVKRPELVKLFKYKPDPTELMKQRSIYTEEQAYKLIRETKLTVTSDRYTGAGKAYYQLISVGDYFNG